jgi:hypothetical protein
MGDHQKEGLSLGKSYKALQHLGSSFARLHGVYKPGTMVKTYDGKAYVVQPDGSWRKQRLYTK